MFIFYQDPDVLVNTISNSQIIMFKRIINELSKIEKVVFLIDEYDKPILDNIGKDELHNIKEEKF